MPADLLGVAPFAIITAGLGWVGAAWAYRDKRRKEKTEQDDRLEIHRDDLTFELLQAARTEVSEAAVEMRTLRDEVRTLRALEQHFFHFQQALDHLEAILFADTPALRATAERAAKAFVKRMRRLNDAKGTLANEIQRVGGIVRLAEGRIEIIEEDGEPT